MSNDPRSRVQEVIKGRDQAPTAETAAAATANYVNFQDWLFFGTAPNIFLQVGITPAASNIAIQYALVVLQSPQGQVLSDAALNTSNANAGWTVNLATDSSLYNIQQYGTQIQGWAYAQVLVGGQPQSQYSAIQNYTVNS